MIDEVESRRALRGVQTDIAVVHTQLILHDRRADLHTQCGLARQVISRTCYGSTVFTIVAMFHIGLMPVPVPVFVHLTPYVHVQLTCARHSRNETTIPLRRCALYTVSP